MFTASLDRPRRFSRFQGVPVATIVAIAIGWIGAAPSDGQDAAPSGPRRLDDLAVDTAHPLLEPRDRTTDAAASVISRSGTAEIQIVLDFHRSGRLDDAREAWSQLGLPPSAEAWRQLAIAMCDLAQDRRQEARGRLEDARRLEPVNPLMHYLWGTYYLLYAPPTAFAEEAENDALVRLVLHAPWANQASRGRAGLAAAEYHFLQAIDLSDRLRDDAPLVTRHDPTDAERAVLPPEFAETPAYSTSPPTVGDYLRAIGCADYLAKSHLGLVYVYLETGAIRRAEQYLQATTSFGLPVQHEWLCLGAAYEQSELHADAARAYLESVAHGPAVVRPMRLAWKNMWAIFR